MLISTTWHGRIIARVLILLLAIPLAEASAAPLQQQPGSVHSTPSSGLEMAAAQTESVDPGSQPSSQAPASTAPQQTETKPAGTAAAPVEKTSGVAASRPAGAVIAPAKQRRSRAILIRLSIVIGAAVAVGTVVALSRASPARPN
jgi:hypothetical protein